MYLNKKKIDILLVRRGMNATQLAELANLSRATVSCIMNGKSCTAKTIVQLATVLDVEPEEILEED